MSEMKYLFRSSSMPMVWLPFDRKTGVRIPGYVRVRQDVLPGDPHRFMYRREYKSAAVELTAPTPSVLSAKIDQYYARIPEQEQPR